MTHEVTSSSEIKVMAKGSIVVYKGKQIIYKTNPHFSMLSSSKTSISCQEASLASGREFWL